MQNSPARGIKRGFPGMVRSALPLFETEIHGVPMPERTAKGLFGV